MRQNNQVLPYPQNTKYELRTLAHQKPSEELCGSKQTIIFWDRQTTHLFREQ